MAHPGPDAPASGAAKRAARGATLRLHPWRHPGLAPRLAQVGASPLPLSDFAVSGLRPAPVVLPELHRSLVAEGLASMEQAVPSSKALANEQGGDVQTGRILNTLMFPRSQSP